MERHDWSGDRGSALKNAIEKLKSKIGVTLAETLATVLIMLMVSSIVATGMPAALNAYRKAVDAANAQVALSTTLNALRSEFSTAWGVKKVSDTELRYFKSDTGALTRLYLDEDTIKVQNYVRLDDFTQVQTDAAEKPFPEHELVSAKAITDNLRVVFTSLDVADNVASFSGIKVVRSTDNATVAKLDTPLSVRLLTGDLTIPDLTILTDGGTNG